MANGGILQTKKYKCDFKRTLGSGSFSYVYMGHDKKDPNIKVAVKEIRNDSEDTARFSESARKEYLANERACGHPNIVRLFEFHSTDRFIYIFMEYCKLGDLEHYVKNRSRSLTQEIKLDIMMQCANGVTYLHNMKPPIIHRDLKPQNILMTQTAQGDIAKISDFGLSKILEDKKYMSTDAGSPKFRAPEMFDYKDGRLQYTSAVDVFALGLVYLVLLKYGKNNCYTFEPYDNPDEPFLWYGLKLLHCRRGGQEFPAILNMTSEESSVSIKIKSLVCKMVAYEPVSRPTMPVVLNELKGKAPNDTKPTQVNEPGVKGTAPDDTIPVQVDEPGVDYGARLLQKDKKISELEEEIMKLQEEIDKLNPPGFTSMPTTGYKRKNIDLKEEYHCEKAKLLNNRLYSISKKHLQIYNLEGDLVMTINLKYNVKNRKACSFVTLNSDQYIVADKEKGVFLLKNDGDCVKQLCEGSFSDLDKYQGKVYGLECKQGKIVTFELIGETWEISKINKAPLHNPCINDGLCVSNNRIYRSSHNDRCLYIYNMKGKLLSTYGEEGHDVRGIKPELLNGPLVCDVDNSGTALVADWGNHRLQTCTATGEWQVITLPQEVQYPTYAVVNLEDQSIWVVSDNKSLNKLTQ